MDNYVETNIMDLSYDVVTGWYLATHPDVHISDSLFVIASQTLEARCHKYGIHPRSGLALFSALLPEDFYFKDICEGILIKGPLRIQHLKKIYNRLEKDYGRERVEKFISDLGIIVGWLQCEDHDFMGQCTKKAK